MKVSIKIYLVLLLALAVGCSSSVKPKTASKPIVKINGTVYTAQDLWDFGNVILWEMEPKDLNNKEVQEQLLNDFIEHRLLVQEAKRRGIKPDKDKVNQLYMQMTTTEGAKELKAVTGHYNIDSDKIAALVEERLMISELFRDVVNSTANVTEHELRNYYESSNIPKVNTGEAHILHIFTTNNATAQAAAKELADGILFQEVARKYSEGPEKNQGGDLGYVKDTNLPEFFNAAFKLKEGEISQVIVSDYGFHIFKMVQYAKAARNSYENMKKTLLADLYLQRRQEVVREFINALHANADIQYLNNFTLAELIPTDS